MIDLTIIIGGEAGYGISSTGLILSKTLAAAGYFVFGYPEYPSLIRGGHNTFTVRVSEQPVSCLKVTVDLLLALDSQTVVADSPHLSERAILIIDDYDQNQPSLVRPQKTISVPLTKLADEIGGDRIMRNTVGLGAIFAILDLPLSFLESEISKEFSDKNPKVVSRNLRAVAAGYRATRQTVFKYAHLLPTLPPDHSLAGTKVVISGNSALAAASLASGLSFSAIYPMTPVQSLLSTLKSLENKFHCQVIQPADEIEGINLAIGAAFAGKRTMVATSGGGFCLMVEGLGLAAQTETPLVIILGSRPGPATGLPTWTEQGDLLFCLHAGHGEFPRLLFTPGNIEEIISVTQQAFALSRKYRLPAIILVDKLLCESFSTTTFEAIRNLNLDSVKTAASPTATKHQLTTSKGRFYPQFSENSLAQVFPGQADFLIQNGGEEHDETGYLCEDSSNRIRMMNRRFAKMKAIKEEVVGFTESGDKKAKSLVVTWGSTLEVTDEAVKLLNAAGAKINHLHLNCFSPFPLEPVVAILKRANNLMMIENNFSGQGAAVIREKTGIEIANKLLKYDGRPFNREEIIVFLKQNI